MGFLSGTSSFVEEHSAPIQGMMDAAGNIPGKGNVADRANTTVDTAKGNADSDVVSSISCIGDTMALASESAKVEKETKDKSALSKTKGMNAMLGGVRGKAKTGAKNAGSGENLKKPSKKKRTKNKCFTGDTPVFTGHGYRLIKEIQKGDDIYSRNTKTGETGVQEVEELSQTETHTVYHIWLFGKEEIKTTAYHPIYVQEQGWVSAINLREGDIVETMDGPAQITKIVKVRHEEKVMTYNLHVKEWASYFVGKIRVFVHNGKGDHDKGSSNNGDNKIRENKKRGDEFEQQEFERFSSENPNAESQITIRADDGTRTRVDAIGRDADGNILIEEYKSSDTARLTRNQKKAFPEIEKSGGVIVGKGKGEFTGGYRIPPGTKIKIVRPQ